MIYRTPGADETVLDLTLGWAEDCRRWHMEYLRAYKPGAARERAYQQNVVYDTNQGGSAPPAEAYWGLPEVVEFLLQQGAKRACELDSTLVDDETKTRILQENFAKQAGALWDVTEMYQHGFTPETQPNRQHWQIVYELARYPADWEEQVIAQLKERYENEDGLRRPQIKLLQTRPADPPVNNRDRILLKMIQMLASLGVPDTDNNNSVWIEASADDSIEAEVRWEVEIINGTTIGRTRAKK
jgi:hypothetical protein